MLYPIESVSREKKYLDGLWQLVFDKNNEGRKKGYASTPPHGKPVAVPGSINEQMVDRDEYLYMGTVWYWRNFRVSSDWSGRRIVIRFGAVNFRAEVYLDGHLIGRHEGGFTPFELDITKHCRYGSNHLLVVRVDNRLSETTIPQGNVRVSVGGVAAWRPDNYPCVHYDYFPFMGIHRHVELCCTPFTYISEICLDTIRLDGESAQMSMRLCVENCQGGTIELKIPEIEFAQTFTLARNKLDEVVKIPRVQPWCPESPKIYKIIFTVRNSEETVDEYHLDYGFRIVELQNEKFLLNGQPIYLKGFGRHEDLNVIGKGLNYPFMVKDYELMKWIGANSFRCSHYPYSEEMLQMADRLGFLVIDEVEANTLSMLATEKTEKREQLAEAHKRAIDRLIRRDRNHPCVIIWSLGNECETAEPTAKTYFRDMITYAKSLDPTRPVGFVLNSAPEEDLAADAADVLMVNSYPAWYGDCGRLEKIAERLDELLTGFWNRFKKPIMLTEFGADALPGMHSEHELMWSEEYQQRFLELVIRKIRQYEYVFGEHVWNFADFKVGQHHTRPLLNWKGVFTRDRHPKLAAHYLRELWKKQSSEAHPKGNNR